MTILGLLSQAQGKNNEHYLQKSSVGFFQASLRCSDCYHVHCLEFSLEIQYIQFAAATFFEMWKYVEFAAARNVFSPRASIGIHIFEALPRNLPDLMR